ncbi:fimbrial protein [Acinetobacter nematophilus]|uniref:Type 1 fimbrial protein n=1 Tax=Acinetobacter nematophilus TaxID=2994642 RepID=A0A9X3DQK8_9GAMM|nr:type 1 fimbrial protein [Acinetobacter nematophilus]MCX5466370.1 type 1 fimbrial protein [Acinetobacter nematophilus]
MKKLMISMLCVLILGLVHSHTFAADGTIMVNGTITNSTCIVEVSGVGVSGLKNIVVTLTPVLKSNFQYSNSYTGPAVFSLHLKNNAGTAGCDAVTNKALKGLVLETASATDYDPMNKALLVNKAVGVSLTKPIFIYIRTPLALLL